MQQPSRKRVIGAEHITEARARGLLHIEILPGDIVTALARDTADRLGLTLRDGPLPKPALQRTDGNTAMRRGLYRRSPRWVAPQLKSAPRKARRINKLALVGAGNVGCTIAQLAAHADVAAEITLIDLVPGLAESIALDLNHASGISRSASVASGSDDLALVKDADVIVVTAGRPRGPGMDRADLISVNQRVIRSVGEAIRVHASGAIVIVVTNPLDEMTAEMLRVTGFPRERVLGMAGTLDSSRFRHALAQAAGVATADVEAITLGSHGDEMAPVLSQARIKERSLDVYLAPESQEQSAHNAVTGGARVVALRRSGSAFIAPAYATMEIIDHIRGARAGSVPASVLLQGEYGIENVVLGVPCVLGSEGLVRVDEIHLEDNELAALKKAASAIEQRLAEHT